MTHIGLSAGGDHTFVRLFPFINRHPPSNTLGLVFGGGWRLGTMTGQHLTFGARPQNLSDDVGTDTFLILLLKLVFAIDLNIRGAKCASTFRNGVGECLTIATETGLEGGLHTEEGKRRRCVVGEAGAVVEGRGRKVRG